VLGSLTEPCEPTQSDEHLLCLRLLGSAAELDFVLLCFATLWTAELCSVVQCFLRCATLQLPSIHYCFLCMMLKRWAHAAVVLLQAQLLSAALGAVLRPCFELILVCF